MQAPGKENKVVQPHNDILYSMGEEINELTQQLSKIKIKNQELQSKIGKKLNKRCPSGHPMRYTYTQTTYQSSFKYCDVCKKKICKVSSVYWSCPHCDFDLCPPCGGYKNTVCAFEHPLQYIPKYIGSIISCDICLTKPLQSGWHCDCGFDICEKCYKFQ